uniref:Putative LOC100741587 [Bombus impatiens] n=1 Tax=Lepeophtheirus salmonis TaxID=72036 RepID=A0A0K2T1A3_LEPSM
MEVILPEAVEAALEAIEHGRTDIVKALLDKVKSLNNLDVFLNQVLTNKKTLLEIAVENEKIDIFRTLLREGADPSIRDDSDLSILQKVQSKRIKDAFGCEFLQAVAQSNPNLQVIKRFLDAGLSYADTYDDPKAQNNALHWAASFGCKEIVEFLVESNPEGVNNTNLEGMTPLHEAALRGSSDIITVMLKAGADPNIRIKEGKWSGKTARDLLKDDMKEYIPETLPKEQLSLVNGDSLQSEEVESVLSEEEVTSVIPRIASESILTSNVISDDRLKLLWPPPQSIIEVEGQSLKIEFKIPLTISPGEVSVHEVLDIMDFYKELMYDQTKRSVILSSEGGPLSQIHSHTNQGIQIVINPQLFHIKGAYKLVISNKGVKIVVRDKEGIHYGITTFIQLMRLFLIPDHNNEVYLKPLIINDYPDTSIRGVLLDLNSYGRVPHFKILMSMIDIWTFMKINHFHVFIRLSRVKKWQLPYSKINILSLDRYCRQRGIHFVPAIDIGGDVNSIEGAKEMVHIFRDVVSCFDSTEFIHLGPKLTSMISNSFQYFDTFISPIMKKKFTLMLCSNSISNSCLTIPSDAILLYYSFEKCLHGFQSNVQNLYSQGYNFAFCSGTNAWSSITGSPDKMGENLLDVKKVCQNLSGIGSINAHWASDPSFNHLVFAWPGYIISSGLGWNAKKLDETNVPTFLEDILGYYIVENKDDARALIELGKIEESLMSDDIVSVLLKLFTCVNEDNKFLSNYTVEDFGEIVQNIRRIQMKLLKVKSPNRTIIGIFDTEENSENETKFDSSSDRIRNLWSREVYLSSELLLISARVGRALLASKTSDNMILFDNLQPTFKTDIANRLLCLIDSYKNVWASSHVLSGLEGSLLVLSKLFKKLVPEKII